MESLTLFRNNLFCYHDLAAQLASHLVHTSDSNLCSISFLPYSEKNTNFHWIDSLARGAIFAHDRYHIRFHLVWGFGFRVSGFGFRISAHDRYHVRFHLVSAFGVRVSDFGFRVSGFGFRISGFGYQILRFGFRD